MKIPRYLIRTSLVQISLLSFPLWLSDKIPSFFPKGIFYRSGSVIKASSLISLQVIIYCTFNICACCSGYAEVLKPEEAVGGGGEGAESEPPGEEEAEQQQQQLAAPDILHTGLSGGLNGTEQQEERISTLTSTLDHMKDRLHSLQEVLKEKDLTDERLVVLLQL